MASLADLIIWLTNEKQNADGAYTSTWVDACNRFKEIAQTKPDSWFVMAIHQGVNPRTVRLLFELARGHPPHDLWPLPPMPALIPSPRPNSTG